VNGTAKDAGLVLLFQRGPVSTADRNVFVGKLIFVVLMALAGGALALYGDVTIMIIGIVVLAATYVHAVELQHQCLHHSAFRKARYHRLIGFPLGLPMLVSYSHYRVRHLQHHRYLGTTQDAEFFGFDTRQPLSCTGLLAGMFDYLRFIAVMRDAVKSAAGRWRYTLGAISPKAHRNVQSEYRIIGVLLMITTVAAFLGFGEVIEKLWLLPLALAVPMHFLVELPEHIGCDSDSKDVLRNTRSITGGALSTWFTNGNNLHVEHHAAMNVPMNKLRARHHIVRSKGKFVDAHYVDFYGTVLRQVARGWCPIRGSDTRLELGSPPQTKAPVAGAKEDDQ
jgi:fatty acid desaturase